MKIRISVLILVAVGVALLPPPAFVQTTPIYWIVRSGQSLSVGSVGYCGSSGYPNCSSGAAYGSLTIFAPNSMYPPADTQFRTLSGHVYQASPPAIESSAISMCNQFNVFSGRTCATADYGLPGQAYSQLKKGGGCASPNCAFDDSIGNGTAPANTGVIQAKTLAASAGRALYVPAVYFNQGESDMNGSTSAATYEANMVQLQSDYETSINSAIGQTGRIPLFIKQAGSWATWPATRTTPTSTVGTDGVPIGQLQACLDHYSDGKILCVGPEYSETRIIDGLHLPQPSYRKEGSREAKAIYRVTTQGKGWRPFYPRSVSLSGNVITVQFWVPIGSLVLDTTNIAPLPDGNMGFEFTDTGSSGVTMPSNSVAIKAGTTDSVTITLSGTPAGTFELRYAWTAPNGACTTSCNTNGQSYTGPINGPRGNVADSDSGLSWAGDPLTDYALTFRIPNISAASSYSWAPAEPNLTTIPGVIRPANGGSVMNGRAGLRGGGKIR